MKKRPFIRRPRAVKAVEPGEIREILRESEETVRRFLEELEAEPPAASGRQQPRRREPREPARARDKAPA